MIDATSPHRIVTEAELINALPARFAALKELCRPILDKQYGVNNDVWAGDVLAALVLRQPGLLFLIDRHARDVLDAALRNALADLHAADAGAIFQPVPTVEQTARFIGSVDKDSARAEAHNMTVDDRRRQGTYVARLAAAAGRSPIVLDQLPQGKLSHDEQRDLARKLRKQQAAK